MSTPADDAQPLQFETALPHGAAVSDASGGRQALTCRACQQAIPDEYFDVNGNAVCASCRDAIAARGTSPRGAMPLMRAGLFGFAAAVAGAILYYAVMAITGLEIGLVAIAIGYMVGFAVQKATDGRGGRAFQVLAVVLTYWSVGLAYMPMVFNQAAEEAASAPAAAGTTEQPAVAPPARPATADERAQPLTASEPEEAALSPLLAAYLFAFSFALPLLVVFGSLPGGLLSAAIIAFGMLQAWRMTASPQFTITGPFRVGAVAQTAT